MSLSVFSAESAFALTTNRATAKSNQTEGNGVIGGKETRLTWEGTVEDEQISQLTLQLQLIYFLLIEVFLLLLIVQFLSYHSPP